MTDHRSRRHRWKFGNDIFAADQQFSLESAPKYINFADRVDPCINCKARSRHFPAKPALLLAKRG